MTDEQEIAPEEQGPDEELGPRAGEKLVAARREQGIAVHEVAKELHLEESKVRALESNDFDALGAPVFAKGHLRKYAQLVGLDIAELLEDYYHLTRADPPPPVVSTRPKIRQELSPAPWIAAILLLGAAAIAYWWFGLREPSTVTRAPAATSTPAQTAGSRTDRQPAQATSADGDIAPADDEAVSDNAPANASGPDAIEPEPEPAAAASEPAPVAVAGDSVALTVAFSGDCWTEISDADGRRLFFAMGRDGQTVELSGKAPLNALFGNGDNVRLLLDGSDYPLPVSSSNNRTLRLTIDAL